MSWNRDVTTFDVPISELSQTNDLHFEFDFPKVDGCKWRSNIAAFLVPVVSLDATIGGNKLMSYRDTSDTRLARIEFSQLVKTTGTPFEGPAIVYMKVFDGENLPPNDVKMDIKFSVSLCKTVSPSFCFDSGKSNGGLEIGVKMRRSEPPFTTFFEHKISVPTMSEEEVKCRDLADRMTVLNAEFSKLCRRMEPFRDSQKLIALGDDHNIVLAHLSRVGMMKEINSSSLERFNKTVECKIMILEDVLKSLE